jgi:hypothetical protein
VVENKDKLLNPICSRFCEIYVPEYIVNQAIQNLHTLRSIINVNTNIVSPILEEYMTKICLFKKGDTKEPNIHSTLVDYANSLYDAAYSSLDIINYIQSPSIPTDVWTPYEIANTCMCFEKIKSEYRCEKMLMFFILDFLVFRSNKNLKSLSDI